MALPSDDATEDSVRESYSPEENRRLSQVVLEAIGEFKDQDMSQTDFVLYDDISPDALDNLFRHDAEPRTTVAFNTDSVRVQLFGDGGVDVYVTDQPESEE